MDGDVVCANSFELLTLKIEGHMIAVLVLKGFFFFKKKLSEDSCVMSTWKEVAVVGQEEHHADSS